LYNVTFLVVLNCINTWMTKICFSSYWIFFFPLEAVSGTSGRKKKHFHTRSIVIMANEIMDNFGMNYKQS